MSYAAFVTTVVSTLNGEGLSVFLSRPSEVTGLIRKDSPANLTAVAVVNFPSVSQVLPDIQFSPLRYSLTVDFLQQRPASVTDDQLAPAIGVQATRAQKFWLALLEIVGSVGEGFTYQPSLYYEYGNHILCGVSATFTITIPSGYDFCGEGDGVGYWEIENTLVVQ